MFTSLLCLGVALLASTASAQHFRYGTIGWQQVTVSGGNGLVVNFTLQTAWTTSQYSGVAVGSTVSESGTYFYPTNVVGAVTPTNPLPLTVTSINTGANWFVATTVIQYTYSTSGTYTAYYGDTQTSATRRYTPLVNNCTYFNILTVLPLTAGASGLGITVSTQPIITLAQGKTTSTFQISAVSNTYTLRYRLATVPEASGTVNVYSTTSSVAVNYTSGLVSFQPLTVGFYTVQVVVLGFTTQNPTTNDASVTQTPVDFLVQVISGTNKLCAVGCSNSGNVCSDNGGCTSCGTNSSPCRTEVNPTFSSLKINSVTRDITALQNNSAVTPVAQAQAGLKFNFTLIAAPGNSDENVTIASGSIPSTATQTISYSGTAVTLTFAWTPVNTDASQILCYTATSTLGYSNNGQLCISVQVVSGALSASGSGLYSATAGVAGSFTIFSSASGSLAARIQSGTTVVGTATVSSTTTTYTYTAAYNVTKSGIFIVNVTELTTPQTIQNNMVVISNPTTDPARTIVYDLGSSGLSGSTAGTALFSYITAYDIFGNAQTNSLANDTFYVQIIKSGSVVSTVNAVYSGASGIYSFNYTVPTGTGSYNVSVFYSNAKRSITGLQVFTTVATIITTTYSGSVNLGSTVTAGNRVRFNITLGTTNSATVGVSIPVNYYTTSPDYCNSNPTGTFSTVTEVYSVTGTTPLAVNSTLVATVASSAATSLSVAVTGASLSPSIKQSYTVVAGALSASTSVVCPTTLVSTSTAGATNTISVYLTDAYLNQVSSPSSYTVNYNYSVAGTTFSGSGTASYSALTGNTFSLTIQKSGTLTVYVFVNGAQIAKSPYTTTVNPGAFSSTTSSLSGITNPYQTTAGVYATFTINALDAYSNARTLDVNADSFIIFMNATKHNTKYSAYGTYTRNSLNGIAQGSYLVSITSTVSGSYTISVLVGPTYYTWISNQALTVYAGPVNTSVTPTVSGAGKSGGVQKSLVELQIQMEDTYGNIVEDARSGYVLMSTTMKGTVTFWSGWFCNRSATSCPKQNPRAVLANDVNDSLLTTDISSEESLVIADGFWKTPYYVPTIPIDGTQSYTITIYWCLWSAYVVNATAESLVTGCTQVYKSSAVATFAGQTLANNGITDNWQAIAIGIIVGSIFLTMMMYGAWRMIRYRTKYVVQRIRAEKAEAELREMANEVDVIPDRDWGKTEENMNNNPLLNPPKPGSPNPKKGPQQIDDPNINMKKQRDAIRVEFNPGMPTLRTNADGPSPM